MGHALAREVMEETRLEVKHVVEELIPSFEYETEVVDGVKVVKSCVQVNFVVEVEEGKVEV